ncbi:hypothetical protein EJP69_14175 [Variovorax gossypii]|uniref:Uncharacterized protein n=1 Tax=Variovorax gossypii TaxID=1679495 RepID=A0A3S0GYV4_9BURK|nr:MULTISPECIES: hypothetical protein [Variovorax]MDR6522198.1 uncharacterized protein YcgL (UPF0745 family) [Variovorax paradoxus]RTQ35504.1 hypothetical protein EJP69_14175 [Variovorax gossypii]
MKIDIYEITSKPMSFVSVPAGADVTVAVPLDMELRPFRQGIDLDGARKPLALDTDEIKEQIARQGYALHAADISVAGGS